MRLIDKFMANKKPLQKSKLSEVNDDILELLGKKYPVKLIHEYITGYRKISVELKYLHRYIKKLQARDKSKETVATTVSAEATTSTMVKIDEPAQEPQKKMSLLEKTAAFLQAQKEAGVEPAPIGYYKPKTLMIDILDKQDE